MSQSCQTSPVVFVFADTEFTSLERPELVSIGLRDSDGDEFYGERTDYSEEHCSAFVRSEVLPKLGWSWHAQANLEELGARIDAWLAPKTTSQVVVLAYDYLDDLKLTVNLLSPTVRASVLGLDVRWDMADDLLREYFARPGVLRHHALHDARALAHACGPWLAKTATAIQPVLERLAKVPLHDRLRFLRTTWPELGCAHPIQALNEGRSTSVLELAARLAANGEQIRGG